jgi:aminoacrylate hydrolase
MEYQIYKCENEDAEYVVLSSGLGGHASFWNPQITALNEHFHILSYDQEGCHANSALLADNYSMTHMAEQVFNILKKENIKQCHFIGHALGGHIGAELASLFTNTEFELLSLTSINAWDELDAHTKKCFQARIALLKHAGAEAYVRAQALFLYPSSWISMHADQIEQAENNQLLDFPPQENVLARLGALQKFKIEDKHISALKNVKVHLIANEDDFLVPVHKSFDLKNKIKHAKLSVFEYGAHASIVTQSTDINDSILKFLLLESCIA